MDSHRQKRDLLDDLQSFRELQSVTSKGQLALLVQLTELISERRGPWILDDFLTKRKGQVARVSGDRVKRILASHGITRTLAAEGSRTSRGSLDLLARYIELLNDLHEKGTLDFEVIAEFWADAVRDYFNNLPFTLVADASRSLTAHFEELFDQVRKRQTESPGSTYLGTVLQHLVGAKLSIILGEGAPEAYGASVADGPTARGGDFVLNDVVIHCTTAPGGALIQKCKQNLTAGLRPFIITLSQRSRTARDLATDAGIAERVEVWDIQQFLATSIHDWSRFDARSRNAKVKELVDRYNDIVAVENDPSLRIEFTAPSSKRQRPTSLDS